MPSPNSSSPVYLVLSRPLYSRLGSIADAYDSFWQKWSNAVGIRDRFPADVYLRDSSGEVWRIPEDILDPTDERVATNAGLSALHHFAKVNGINDFEVMLYAEAAVLGDKVPSIPVTVRFGPAQGEQQREQEQELFHAPQATPPPLVPRLVPRSYQVNWKPPTPADIPEVIVNIPPPPPPEPTFTEMVASLPERAGKAVSDTIRTVLSWFW